MHLVVRLALLGIALFVMAGCSRSDSSSQPLTVEQYAQEACAILQDDDFGEDITWGQAHRQIEDTAKRLDRIKPPAEVKVFHQANVAAVKAYTETAKDKDQDAVFNPYEVISEPWIFVLGAAIRGAEEAMDEETRQTLNNNGCEISSDA